MPRLLKAMNVGISNAPGVSVRINVAGTSTLAALFSDNLGQNPIVNPTSFDGNGRLQVFIADGYYDFVLAAPANYTVRGVEHVSAFMLRDNQRGFSVKQFGAVGDGTADDTAAIQAAITAAQLVPNPFVGIYGGMTAVLFPPGAYRVTNTLDWSSCHLIGLGPTISSVLVWGGANGGITLHNNTSQAYKRIENLGFISVGPPNNVPGSHISCVAEAAPRNFPTAIDYGNFFHRLAFQVTSGPAIKFSTWYNCHLTDCRFDACGAQSPGGSPCILLTPQAAQHGSVFNLDRFTADNGAAVSGSVGGTGVLKVDNSAGNSDIGIIRIANGRIEVNTALQGFLAAVMVLTDTGATSNWCTISLENLFVDNVVGQAGVAWCYADSPTNTQHHRIIVQGSTKATNDVVLKGPQGNMWNGTQIASTLFGTNP